MGQCKAGLDHDLKHLLNTVSDTQGIGRHATQLCGEFTSCAKLKLDFHCCLSTLTASAIILCNSNAASAMPYLCEWVLAH